MLSRVTFALPVLLLTPTACSGPTIQMDVYVWGYDDGIAYYHGWYQCDYKSCDDCIACFRDQVDNQSIAYETYNYDSLLVQGDNWTNDCLDTTATFIY